MEKDLLIKAITRTFSPSISQNKIEGVDHWNELSDEWVESLGSIVQSKYCNYHLFLIPRFMIWALNHEPKGKGLVIDNIIEDITEYGKCKNPALEHINIKHICSDGQKVVIRDFLNYFLNCSSYLLDERLLVRVIRNWS